MSRVAFDFGPFGGVSGGYGMGMGTDVAEKRLDIWEQDVFTADLCESLISRHAESFGDYAPTMKSLLERLLSRSLHEDCRMGVIKMIQGLEKSQTIFRRKQQHQAWHIPFHLSRIVDEICKQLHSSSVGDVHVFPFHVNGPSVVVVEQERHGVFSAGVINTNPASTEYHPFKAMRVPKVLMQTVLELKNIPKARITSEAFWATELLAEGADDQIVYTHFIPWANQRTHAEIVRDTRECYSTGTKSENGNLWKNFIHALKYCLRKSGVSNNQIKAVRLMLKQLLLEEVKQDLASHKTIPYSTRLIINAALSNTAMALTRNGRELPQEMFEGMMKLIDTIKEDVEKLPCPDEATTKPPPLLNLTEEWEKIHIPDMFPLAECHRRLENVDDFIGTAVDQPRYVPVNFFKVPSKVSTFDEALAALDELVAICTRISSQLNVVRNGSFLILSLLTQAFGSILPIPLGNKSKQKESCLWNSNIRYGQQLHCMKRLFQCSEYFIWASFAIKATKEFDAQRIIVLGAIATIGDAVIRLIATDHPSLISTHLKGYKKKPAFAVSLGKFASQTESSITVFPELLLTRAAILDYHAELLEEVPSSNVMWAWEDGWDFCKATQLFIRQVCLVEGFSTQGLMSYFIMERDGLHCVPAKYWEEYRYHRDMYIMFKWMMAPKAKLPNCTGCLQCKVRSPDVRLSYGNHKLQVRYMHKEVMAKALQLRWPSFAIPSKFTAPFEANTEDDILHIKNLPTFDDSMGQRDAELLLSYLTAPYIRIPLILNYFATEDRVSCLGISNIKNLLEAILFEPGKFLPRSLRDKVPTQVPSEDSAMLATPYGLLINELQFSPMGVIEPLIKLVKLAREMDAGTIYNASVVDIIMFLMRLVARVETFIRFCLELAHDPEKTKRFRGLSFDQDGVVTLKAAQKALRELADEALLPMLESWNDEVMQNVVKSAENAKDIDDATRKSAQLHAHSLLLLRNVAGENVTQNICSQMLASTMFLTTRYTWSTETLYIPETEVFDVMQRNRRGVVAWLYQHSERDMAAVMDSVVRVATSTGQRTSGPNYNWGYVAGEDCLGRFTRVDEETTKRPEFDSKTDDLLTSLKEVYGFDRFPCKATCINEGLQDVEINIHILSLTFKAAHLVALPGDIASMQDTRTIFAPKVAYNEHMLRSMQCAVIQDSEHRQWVRLVGQEHDIQFWKSQDPRVPLPSDMMRFYPDDLSDAEDWIFNLVEPIRRSFFVRSFWQPPIFLLLPEHKLTSDQNTCILAAVCSKTGKKLKEIVALRDMKTVHVYELFSLGRRFYRRLVFTTDCHYSYRELQPSVHDRRNPWQPWQRHAAGEFEADETEEPQQSAVVLRHSTHPDNVSKAVETFLPRRILEGLIPQTLLETHTFWQDPDDNIRGYPNEKNALHLLWIHWKDVEDALFSPSPTKCVHFQVFRFARSRSAPKVSENAILKSQKLNIADETEEELERMRPTSSNLDQDADEQGLEEGMYREATQGYTPKAESATLEDYNLLLVNLLYAREGTPLHSIAKVFARIELLSHVLCWTTQVDYDSAKGGPVKLDLIQLPRLKLSFSARVDSDGSMRLYSLDHAHLFVSNLRPQLVCNLLQGIPHSILLGDMNDNMSILVPALEVVRPSITNAPFSTELVINRENKKWYMQLDTRYYLYPVHVSLSFLFTQTLASALYLLVLRFLHCEYDDVFRLASSIGTDVEFSPEEQQNFEMLKFPDERPEAHACRAKIGLLVADSPITLVWSLPKSTAAMIRAYNTIGLSCKLKESEERRLLQIVMSLLKKLDIVDALANKVNEEVLDGLVSRIINKNPMIFEGSASERKELKAFYKQIAVSLRNELDVRITRDETTRLLYIWALYRRFVEFPHFLRCIISNRAAFLDAEAKAVETGLPVPVEYNVPALGKDEYWPYYKDYDALSVKIPEAQGKLKNEENRVLRLSDVHDYFYCGQNVRKAGSCKCHDCGEECGPDSGCPCPSCEKWNKANLHKTRFLPQSTNVPSQSTRLISFFDVFSWMEDLVGEDTSAREESKRVAPDLQLFHSGVRRMTMRDENNSFLRYYEMITGTTKVRIGSGDCAKDLVHLLFPLSHEARKPHCAYSHLMHYLLNNPQVWNKLPKYNRTSKTSFESRMSAIYTGIMQQAAQNCKFPGEPPIVQLPGSKCKAEVVPRAVTRSDPFVPISTTRILPILNNTDSSHRKWCSPNLKVLAIEKDEKVDISEETRQQLRSQLLSGLLSEDIVVLRSKEQLKEHQVDSKLKFDLHKHPAAATSVAKSMIHRLEQDMVDFATEENKAQSCRLVGLCGITEVKEKILGRGEPLEKQIAHLNGLQAKLVALREEDAKFVTSSFKIAERTANEMRIAEGDTSLGVAMMHLRRVAGQEAVLGLSYLISCLACTTAESDLRQLNPFLTKETCGAILDLLATAVLRANRIGHINRCAEANKELIALLKKAQVAEGIDENTLKNLQEVLIASISQKADSLAGLLATKRVYIDENYEYDPRFLIFEFTWNLILRKRQRILIEEIYGSIQNNTSIVKQMIMGAGKTTVVGPILALMLADTKNLVIQVVPPALLDFSRSILRATFSCVIQKQIFCFACDRASEVDSEVLSKFLHAKQSRGIVVTTPSSIKSLFLKYVEGLDRIEDTSRKPLENIDREIVDIGHVLKLWKDAVLIMDEVDLLLHPLKSELNFPIGAKHDIDFAPTRWKLPMHIIDGLFYFHTKRISLNLKDNLDAQAALAEIAASLKHGLNSNALQSTPHLTLLNLEFYEKEMKLPMAKWLLFFLKAHHFSGLTDDETLLYITKRPSMEQNKELNEKVTALEVEHVKTLNLAYEWLSAFLPHVMQKIDRVSFGIMNLDDMKRARDEHPNMPRSRFVTAIPFIGKDLPSQSSEFAHPDVVIGLTIMAYRYEGLRTTDFTDIMREVHAGVEKEVGRFNQRKTNLMYNKWVKASGGRILQSFAYGEKKVDREEDEEMGMQPSESIVFIEEFEEGAESVTKKGQSDVLPLKLMKQANKDESDKLYRLFRRTPEVIHWYLNEHIFPDFMRHQKMKLSASGQELGGNILFQRRIGFSGTPSDLLPHELGKCEYEPGTDGNLIYTLTSPHVMSYHVAEHAWTVRSLLDQIANASPPFHALIDTGALITGMSNLQVAKYFLKHGLPQMEGVVFLDELDRKMILVRATGRVLKLAECGIPKMKRFAFYDQVHTTGMDIEHTPNAVAVQTLGKDMTFRDFSQGAYRMRGIGQGQAVHLLIIPEVYDLIQRTLKTMRAASASNTLIDVAAWLLVNSIRSEHTQHNQLCIQTICNVWRKSAFSRLVASVDEGSFKRGEKLPPKVLEALSVYREPVDYNVPQLVPQPRMFSESIAAFVKVNELFIEDGEGRSVVNGIVEQTKREDEIDNPVIDVQMVQEQEEEREAEGEKEKEQEIELEKYVDLAYSRDDEVPVPWALDSLRDFNRAVQFFRLRDFHLYKRRPMQFPDPIMMSRNFFNPKWSGHRRLKNVMVTMEWIPDLNSLKVLGAPTLDFGQVPSEQALAHISSSLKLLKQHQGNFDKNLAKEFILLGLGASQSSSESDWEVFRDDMQPEEINEKFLASNFLRKEEEGRYSVALSLCEAETVRRVIHAKRLAKQPFIEGHNTAVSLLIAPANNVALDQSLNFKQAQTDYQRQRAYECFRFFDSDLHYTESEINMLLRSIHCSPPKVRQAFFLQVIACRRRARQRWESTPVSLLFNLENPYTLLHQRTIGLCMRREFEALKLHLGDAYVAMNSSRSGQLSPDEVWGGMRFCRLNITAGDVLDFIQVADTHHEGTLYYPDFLAMLTGMREIDDEGGKDEKRLPTIEPCGAEELRNLRGEMARLRREAEEGANKEMESEDKRVKEEIEQEMMREELALIQTCPNPKLGENNLEYNFQNKETIPKLAQFFGKIIPTAMKQNSDGINEPPHFAFTSASVMKILGRSLKLITNEPTLSRFSFSVEFKLPHPTSNSGKKAKNSMLRVIENDGFNLNLFKYPTCGWELRRTTRAVDKDDDDEDEDGNDDDSYCSDEEDEDRDERKGFYVYSEPRQEKKLRVARVHLNDTVIEDIGERLNTSAGAVSVEWMKIKAPIVGWVVFDEGGTRFWSQEVLEFTLMQNGSLYIDIQTSSDEITVPPTVFEEKKILVEEEDSDDDLWDWRFIDYDDEYGCEEDEEEEEGNNFDMGDLTDLVAALKRAKELKVGDKVTRNSECWEGHGNEDGGEGVVGKIVKVDESKVNVQWPNGFKGTYCWGDGGKFELVKVGSADDEDDYGREIVNDDKWAKDLKKKGRNRCSSCSQALNMEANNGWFRCNFCNNYSLCKKCFKAMEHMEHDFTDMFALSEMIKSTQLVRGSTVRIRPDLKEPKNGWQDAPRDGSPGVVVDLDDELGTVQVSFNDDIWYGMMNEVVVVDAKFEAYSATYLGSLFNVSSVDKKMVKFLLAVVEEELKPPVVEGKFKMGQHIKAKWRGSRYCPGEIRAVLPKNLYAVAFYDGDFDDKLKEEDMCANPFVKGAQVRVKGRINSSGTPYFSYSLNTGVTVGMSGEVMDVFHYSGTRLRLRVKIRSGMRIVTQNLCDDEVELVGEGKWSFAKEGGEKIPLPNSANVIIERAFSDGVVSTDLYIRDGTYTINFEQMEMLNPKTHLVIGQLFRAPEQKWVKQREKVNFDDDKWHVFSVIVNGNEDICAICDGKTIPVEYDGPNWDGKENDSDGSEAGDGNEEEEEGEEGKKKKPAKEEEEQELKKNEQQKLNDEYADRKKLPELFDTLLQAVIVKKPPTRPELIQVLLEALKETPEEQENKQPKATPEEQQSKHPKPTLTHKEDEEEEEHSGTNEEGEENDESQEEEESTSSEEQKEKAGPTTGGIHVKEEGESSGSEESGSEESGEDSSSGSSVPPPKKISAQPIADNSDESRSRSEERSETSASESSESSSSGSDDDDDDGSSDSSTAKVPKLKRLKRRIVDVCSLDVRHPIHVVPFNAETCGRGRYGAQFPCRMVANATLSWGEDACLDTALKYFAEIDKANQWSCVDCKTLNSRLLDVCSSCQKERVEQTDKASRKAKVRVVNPKSKEANEVRKKMHARLRSQYQRQLEALEDYSHVL